MAMNIFVAVKTAVVPAPVAWSIEKWGLWRDGMRWHGCWSGPGSGKMTFEVLLIMSLFATVMLMPGTAVNSTRRGCGCLLGVLCILYQEPFHCKLRRLTRRDTRCLQGYYTRKA